MAGGTPTPTPTPEALGLRLYALYVGRELTAWPDSVTAVGREHWTLTAVSMDRASRRDVARLLRVMAEVCR